MESTKYHETLFGNAAVTRNISESVKSQLKEIANKSGEPFQAVLNRFGIERLLYRISILPATRNYLLKGAQLFNLWYDQPFRPTKDIDFLGFGSNDLEEIRKLFIDLSDLDLADGLTFDSDTVRVFKMNEENRYPGVRVALIGRLNRSEISVKIDIGFGDKVTTLPEEAVFPVLIDEFPQPKLFVYPIHTVVAEKVEAIVRFGLINSRLKDYFDLQMIFKMEEIEERVLIDSIIATFSHRGTEIPSDVPPGLSPEYFLDQRNRIQWRAFLHKNELGEKELEPVVQEIAVKLVPILRKASNG